jgi:hypothetical protein
MLSCIASTIAEVLCAAAGSVSLNIMHYWRVLLVPMFFFFFSLAFRFIFAYSPCGYCQNTRTTAQP